VTEGTRDIVDRLHDAFVQGDHDLLACCYDDQVDWTLHAPASVFPFAGRRCGKAAVFLSLKELYTDYKVAGFAPQVIVVDGDRAASMAEVALVQRSSGRTIRCRVASFYHMRNGRVIEYQGFLDSFDAVEQVLGRYIEVQDRSPINVDQP
jgi:ketosteroid isomerase-like protein